MGSTAQVRTRSASALAGTLLVLLGVLLLLTATGTVSFGIWLKLFDFWPVILVLIGAEFILADAPLAMRAGIVTAALLAAIAIAFAAMPEYEPAEPLRVSYTEPANDVEALNLNASFFGGDVAITSEPPADGPSPALMVAEFADRPARVVRGRAGSELTIDVVSSGPYLSRSSADGNHTSVETVSLPFGLADWALTMSPGRWMEAEINIDAFAADLHLDLRHVNVRRLSVEGAVADLAVHLPVGAGQTQVDIAAGVANVEFVVPDGVAALVEIDSLSESIQINSSRFVETENGYRSVGYSEAENRVLIDIESLAANVTIKATGDAVER